MHHDVCIAELQVARLRLYVWMLASASSHHLLIANLPSRCFWQVMEIIGIRYRQEMLQPETVDHTQMVKATVNTKSHPWLCLSGYLTWFDGSCICVPFRSTAMMMSSILYQSKGCVLQSGGCNHQNNSSKQLITKYPHCHVPHAHLRHARHNNPCLQVYACGTRHSQLLLHWQIPGSQRTWETRANKHERTNLRAPGLARG